MKNIESALDDREDRIEDIVDFVVDEEGVPVVSEITDPALEKLVNIRYFLKEGKKYRDAIELGEKDYRAMREMLVEYFPAKFTLPGLPQVNPNLKPTDITKIQGYALKTQFSRVFDYYYSKHKSIL